MSTINPTNTPVSNPQLTGIVNSVPMPAVAPSPHGSVSIGADGTGFSLPSIPQPGAGQATGASSVSGGGQVLVGGGGQTPANGAQPAPPQGLGTGMVPASSTPTIMVPTAASGTPNPATTTTTTGSAQTDPQVGSPLAQAISGFGKASRDEPIKAQIDGATFGFPSFKASARSNTAPEIQWGPGWKKVEKDGMWWMEHTNGSKAVPAVEYRITPKPADKVQSIKVANGWGKRFPDGSLLIFDRKEGPYRLDPQGNKHKVDLGNLTIGGVKVRVFEASVVRTMDKDGKVDVFDSRGNVSKGSTRWNTAAPLGSAAAGATMGSGGASKADGGGAPGKLVGGGPTFDSITGDVEALTGIAREIVDEIRSGSVDPARLASLQAQLSKLPSGILQAAGAAGTMVPGAGTTTGTTTDVGGVSGPPAAGTSSGGGSGATGSTPTPGVDANASTKDYPAGTSVRLDASAIPADLADKQARFGQLPDSLQQAIAKAFGSDRGSAAFEADQLMSFGKDGTVRMVEAGTAYVRHQSQVRGAGPGEERALTMRPNRQPGSTGSVSGGGQSASGTASGSGTTTTPTVSGGGSTSGAGTGATTGSRAPMLLWPAGGETRHVDFGGLNGTYTYGTLPARAKAALLEILRTGGEDASKKFASRTGTGWTIDPAATIVIDSGFASFPGGLTMFTAAGAPRPGGSGASVNGGGAGSGSGPSSEHVGHDATRPPGSGGTGGTVRPSTPPPTPSGTGGGSGGSVGNGAHSHA